MLHATNRRLWALQRQLQTPPQPESHHGAGGHDDVAARSVSFLASLVRAQTDVEDGEPCPGEVAVQRAISARLNELGCSVTDM